MVLVAKQKPRRTATYADLAAVPADLVAELLAGELVTHPRPANRHSTAHVSLIDEVVGPFQKRRGGGPGGWVFKTEPELHLGEHVCVPDIAGWRRERMTAEPEGHAVTLPPDWICEVLSPSTVTYDRTIKFSIYHQHGVGHLWYLDPVARTLEVYERDNAHWIVLGTYADFQDVSAKPFDAISFNLGLLWPFDEPPATEA
jgi:Uma2 family endonuclease